MPNKDDFPTRLSGGHEVIEIGERLKDANSPPPDSAGDKKAPQLGPVRPSGYELSRQEEAQIPSEKEFTD